MSRAGRWAGDLLFRAAVRAAGFTIRPDGRPVVRDAPVLAVPHLFAHDSRLPHCGQHDRFDGTCTTCVDILEVAVACGEMPSLDGPDPG
jgi:hypothetical protein